MSNIRINLSSPTQNQDSNRFSKAASGMCLVLALVVWGLSLGFETLVRNLNLTGRYLGYVALAVSGLSLFLLLIGSIAGLLALVRMKAGGRGGIVFGSLAGLAISGLFVAIFVPNFVRARDRALARYDAYQNFSDAVNDVKAQLAGILKTNGQAVDLTKVNEALEKGAQTSTGEEAPVYKATQAYLAHLKAAEGAYQNAMLNIKAAHVLSTSNVVSSETLQQRKQIVQNFIKCNADLKDFISAGEDNYRAELVRFNASPLVIDSAVAGFHKSSEPRRPLLLAVHEQDDEIGRGMLAVLDILDTNWGQWHFDRDTGHVRFEDSEMAREYNADLQGINDAAKEQAVTKNELATMLSEASAK